MLMELSYFHVADDLPKDFVPETAVVIDVLRATTTIACALDQGAEAVETFSHLDELRKRADEWPESSRLLLGERGGKTLEGFDGACVSKEVLDELSFVFESSGDLQEQIIIRIK